MQKVKSRLEVITGKKVIIKDNTLKVSVKELDNIDIYNLNYFNLNKPENEIIKTISIKRSGTGLTILVTLKS